MSQNTDSWMSSGFFSASASSSPAPASSPSNSAASTTTIHNDLDNSREHAAMVMQTETESAVERSRKRARVMGRDEVVHPDAGVNAGVDVEAARPPYLYSMLAGGIGGTSGDMLMHSLDTVKTRQQGDPHIPPRYTSMSSSYVTILRQEGIRRGLYSGVVPALLGSFPGTVIFFGVYEWSKRNMLDAGVNPSLSYLASGFMADLAASVVYVPSEVLKTRQQLQGRYNNPFFRSGYNYRGTIDAFRTIVRDEGFGTLFSGYKATLCRDLPFSALQFAFYEQEQKLAKQWVGSREIGLPLEILTATTAGGMAGIITCPLDVVKTRTQTQLSPDSLGGPSSSSSSSSSSAAGAGAGAGKHTTATKLPEPGRSTLPPPTATGTKNVQCRSISTSSPSTYTLKPGAPVLDTSSVFTGLKLIYQTEGLVGWFRGVGPRFLWTSVQSGTMLVLYQYLLRKLDTHRQQRRQEKEEEEELGGGGLKL
ncbi:hypothetical protein PABG_05204 [Paracoccidioides brasiliensis Pb03]|nr:hypothetical protein PABG_05204 [Paracoccidioides brasiliensis Pb03]